MKYYNSICDEFNKRLGAHFGNGKVFCFLKPFPSTTNNLLVYSSQINNNISATTMVLSATQGQNMRIQTSTVLAHEYDIPCNTSVFVVIVMYTVVVVVVVVVAAVSVIIIVIVCEYELQGNTEGFYCETYIRRTPFKKCRCKFRNWFYGTLFHSE
jgi:hypothetical protein